MRRLLTGLLSATLVLGACGDDDDGDRAAVTSIPDETTSSTTTEPPVPPPDVIPTDLSLITEEYVEQVLDELYEVDLSAVRMAREAGAVDRPAIELLEATTSEPALAQRVNDLIDLAASGFTGIHPSPRRLDATVIDLIEARERCLVVELRIDSTQMFPDSTLPPGAREFARLLAATPEQLKSGLNPTAWTIDQFPVTLDGSSSPVRCEP